MDPSFCFQDLVPVTEDIMSVKNQLSEKKCMDSVLLSNLEFAERVLRHHPLNSCSKLLVKGDHLCIQIGKTSQLIFTVTSENKNPSINLYIYNYGQVKKSNIMDHHFYGHSCQDEIKSCVEQAREAVPPDGLDRLMIKCNRFSITYASNTSYQIKTVETNCQFKLDTITLEGLLERKIWLEKEKATSHGLIACLDHLIKKYLIPSGAPKTNCRFIIHADKEIIKIISSDVQYEYLLLYDGGRVAMFPPMWQKSFDSRRK